MGDKSERRFVIVDTDKDDRQVSVFVIRAMEKTLTKCWEARDE